MSLQKAKPKPKKTPASWEFQRKEIADSTLESWFRKVVKLHDGTRCLFCKDDYLIEIHHIKGRGKANLQYLPINGVPLCRQCHTFGTNHPKWMNDRLQIVLPTARWDWLHSPEAEAFSMTREDQLAVLKAEVKEMTK